MSVIFFERFGVHIFAKYCRVYSSLNINEKMAEIYLLNSYDHFNMIILIDLDKPIIAP